MPQSAPIDTGLFLGQIPYAAAGGGPDVVVIFPHIREALEDIRGARWCHRWLRRFSRAGSRVYIIGRRIDLPETYTTRAMADDCARVLRSCIGPAKVMGFSLGGLIAQHVAAGHPDMVSALVLAVSGARIAPAQHAQLRRWIGLARRGRWLQIYHDMAAVMLCGASPDMADRSSFFFGPALQRMPADPQRFITSVQASLDHDGREVLGRIASRTLVIGGAEDSLFPAQIIYQTQQRIPGSQVALIENAGHGAFDEQKRLFDRHALGFLCQG